MAGVVIEELDNSSEDSFGTPKSSHSNDEFHDPALDPQEKPDAPHRHKVNRGHKAEHSVASHGHEGLERSGDANELATSNPLKDTAGVTGSEKRDKANSSQDSTDPSATQEAAVHGPMTSASSPSEQEVLQEADRLKAEANKLYGCADYVEALEVYKEALDALPEGATQQRAVLYANMAATRIKLEEYAEAAKDCSASLALEPPTALEIKALSRRSLAYEKLDDLERALADYEKLVSVDGSNSSHKAAVRRLKPVVEERREKMKEEMIGKLKDLGNSFLGKFGMSIDNFKAEKDPSTGSYSINFKQ